MELVWAARTEADLLAIASYYGERDPDLPASLIERAYDAARILAERPGIGPPVERTEFRKWLVRGTPFLLLYRVEESRVEIARVVHGASDWRKQVLP